MKGRYTGMASTLTELSEKYGITKVTAKTRLVNLGVWDGHTEKQGRAYVIDDEAVEEFAKHYEPAAPKAAPAPAPVAAAVPVTAPSNEDLVAELRDMVEYLKEQLAQKDDLASKQLAEKDEQIARRDEQISQLISK